MLEPTSIHSYEPPAYRVHPPSKLEGNPPSLPFACVVLESADAAGAPPPSLLHSLREQGTKLILAQVAEELAKEHEKNRRSCTSPASTPRRSGTAGLNREWFDAVFDKVVTLAGDEGSGKSQLERYWSDNGIEPNQALCFASTELGSKCLAAAESGLILTAQADFVWRINSASRSAGKSYMQLPGADVATPQCPTARQLAWLHTVFTMKLWCACLWLCPSTEEFVKSNCHSAPSANDRAVLTAVRSPTVGALGHPAWLWQDISKDREKTTGPVCTCTLGKEVLACPDWTPMEPRIRYAAMAKAGVSQTRYTVTEIKDFQKVEVYCHSLDVGVAEVNCLAEAVDRSATDGCRVRVASRRLASLARAGHAAAELSMIVLEPCKRRGMPELCVRSYLRLEQIPQGFHIAAKSVDREKAMLKATFVEEQGKRCITVTCWHRVVRDDGRGDVHMGFEAIPMQGLVCVAAPADNWGKVHNRDSAIGLDFIITAARKGSRYTLEKIVSITGRCDVSATLRRISPKLGPRGMNLHTSHWETLPSKDHDEHDFAPFGELEEEHRSAWRAEWDRADIEVVGFRKAARFQRVVRLFRFHQVARGTSEGASVGETRVPDLVRQLFYNVHRDLCEEIDYRVSDKPSSVILSRIIQPDPRYPAIRFEPRVPPACERLQFNCALGGRWHRFTLTPGTVQILVQGPTQNERELMAEQIKVPPKFLIPSHETGERGSTRDVAVEVCTLPWHEVQVQHSLTELGRPDGSAGGFYSLMRRTRFTRVEVLRRLLKDWAPGEEETPYNDDVLTAPLRGALAGLKSAPRPPNWHKGDSKDLHMLQADASTRVRVVLEYEKSELERDILFLDGKFERVEGCLGGDDLVEPELLTIEEAKRKCYTIPGCKGFCFENPHDYCAAQPEPKTPDGNPMSVLVHFKDYDALDTGPGSRPSAWTTFKYTDGETALLDVLRKDHVRKLHKKAQRSKGSKHAFTEYPEHSEVLIPQRQSSAGTWSRASSEDGEEGQDDSDLERIPEEQELKAEDYMKEGQGEGIPSWDACSELVNQVLTRAAERGEAKGRFASDARIRCAHKWQFQGLGDEPSEPRVFKNLITDRDGTVNNYCDRYSSCVQSAYNAAWLSHFARTCTENAVIVTAAPLGGRPSSEGLMELCVAPRGEFTYTGSKGREYFDLNTQRVVEAADLPQEERELVDELHRRILALCAAPGNMKFLGIGSGLQRKFGEVTMARNDPAGTVPDPESRRFMAAVRQVKEELDPEGTMLDMHDTGTDLEIFPKSAGRAFDKGSGVETLEEKLTLGIPLGPNIVCGDTGSDVAMVISTLKLMCGEDMVKIWKERMKQEDEREELDEDLNRLSSAALAHLENASAAALPNMTPSEIEEAEEELERRKRDEEERRQREEEEEREAREAAAGLAVLFVATPKDTEKSMKLAETVRRWCEVSGAQCAIVPSPDVLVAGLTRFANQTAGRSVLDPVRQDLEDMSPESEAAAHPNGFPQGIDPAEGSRV